jgi:hypothetical protein
MFHGHLDYFQLSPRGCTFDRKLGDHGTPDAQAIGLFYFIMREDPNEKKFIEIAFG